MSHVCDMRDPRTLEDELREALYHLYDPVYLRNCPLATLLGLQHHANPAKELRTALLDAIDALRLETARSTQAMCQRYHEILMNRFVEQFTQDQTALQLGVSRRHLTRLQGKAIEALADELARRYPPGDCAEPEAGDDDQDVGKGTKHLNSEIALLADSLAYQATNLGLAVQETLQLAQPLANAHHVTLELVAEPGAASFVGVAGTVVKTTLLTVITALIRSLSDGRLRLTVQVQHNKAVLQFTVTARDWEWPPTEQDGLDLAYQMMDAFGGELVIAPDPASPTVVVTLPIAQPVVVLAIEDNTDTLQLWERFLQDTPFRLVHLRDPKRALAAIAESRPQVIILDVMMPGIDGWSLLRQIREQPEFDAVSIIVCTVLPQEELALSLGANAFVRKPAVRQELLSTLTRQIGA